jgi:hypothetical protein
MSAFCHIPAVGRDRLTDTDFKESPILRLKCFHPPKRDNWPTRSHDWVDKYQVRRAASNNGIK